MPTALVETRSSLDRRVLVGMALDAQLGRSNEEITAMRQVTQLIGVLTNPESSLTQAISGTHNWTPDAFNRDPIVRKAHKVMTTRLDQGLFQSGIHSLEENPKDVSQAAQRLISQLRKEQSQKGTILPAFQKLQQAKEPDTFWDLIQHDSEVGSVVRLFSQTLLDITKARYAKAEAIVATNNSSDDSSQPILADGTIFSTRRRARVNSSLLTKLTLTVAALSLVISACGGAELHDKTLMNLPQPTQTALLAEGGETDYNRQVLSQMVSDYCVQTGCDPQTLLSHITLSDKPDPNKLLHMVTVMDQGMTIYSTSTTFKNAGPFYHEFSHVDVEKVELSAALVAKMGLPGQVYTVGFSLDAPELGDKRSLTSLEEAAADAMMMIVGEKQGVYFQPDLNKKAYGNMGLFLLRLAGIKGISNEDFIKMHRESDLFGFIERITGKPEDTTGFLALYSTVDEMRAAMQKGIVFTVDKAMQEYELFKKEFEKLSQPTQGAFFRLPWNQEDSFALKAWKRIVRGNTDPSMEVALANKYVLQKAQRANLATTLPNRRTLYHA